MIEREQNGVKQHHDINMQHENLLQIRLLPKPQSGVGGTPLYKPYRYVPPQRVWFLHHFGLKTGIDFKHFGLESGMVFEGTTGVYEHTYRFNSFSQVSIAGQRKPSL